MREKAAGNRNTFKGDRYAETKKERQRASERERDR